MHRHTDQIKLLSTSNRLYDVNRAFKKPRWLLQRKLHFEEVILLLFHVGHVAQKTRIEVRFRLLGTNGFHAKQRMKDLLLWARVVVRTSNMKIAACRQADCANNLHQNTCCTCSTIIFPNSTNQIIVICGVAVAVFVS